MKQFPFNAYAEIYVRMREINIHGSHSIRDTYSMHSNPAAGVRDSVSVQHYIHKLIA